MNLEATEGTHPEAAGSTLPETTSPETTSPQLPAHNFCSHTTKCTLDLDNTVSTTDRYL